MMNKIIAQYLTDLTSVTFNSVVRIGSALHLTCHNQQENPHYINTDIQGNVNATMGQIDHLIANPGDT